MLHLIPKPLHQLVLKIDGELNYYLNDNKIPYAELPDKLEAIAAENPGQPVFVKADGGIEYRHVMKAMAALKNAGMPKVGLVSNPVGGDPDEDETDEE